MNAEQTGRNGRERRGLGAALLAAALIACAPLVSATERIGTAVFARGAVTASLENDIRLIGHGTPIYERDVLTTGRDSFAIVKLADGTRVALRPNTVFRIRRIRHRRGTGERSAQPVRGRAAYGDRCSHGATAGRLRAAYPSRHGRRSRHRLQRPPVRSGLCGGSRRVGRGRRRRTGRRRTSRVREGGGERGFAVRPAPHTGCRRAGVSGRYAGDRHRRLRRHRISRREPDHVAGKHPVPHQPARVRCARPRARAAP